MNVRFHIYEISGGIGCVLVVVVFLFFQCTDQTQNNVCADPLGSQNVTINSSDVYYNNCFFCFKAGVTTPTDTCRYNNCFQFYYSSSGQTIRSIYFETICTYGTLVDVGPVNCLGEVVQKPASGFVYSLAPKLKHGYVVAFPDNTYGRFFIDSWETQSGEITSLNIIRQYPF